MGPGADAPHLPRLAPIDAYGKGGFRFAGMSHRGSILCLPGGIWAWPVVQADEIDEAALAPAFAAARELTHFILGTGVESWIMPGQDLQHPAGRAAAYRRRPHRGGVNRRAQPAFLTLDAATWSVRNAGYNA